MDGTGSALQWNNHFSTFTLSSIAGDEVGDADG